MGEPTEKDKLNNKRAALDSILLDISIDVQNELIRQCKKHNLDDWQTDNVNENTIAVFNLNKEKYINKLMKVK